jgi:hypothetical protein
MHPLLTLKYWFALNPTPFLPWADRALLVLFGAFTVFGIITWIVEIKGGWNKSVKRALDRAASLLIWSGIVGLLLWSFSYERVPILSMRVFYLPWVAWIGYGAWSIWHYLWVEVPAKEELHREQIERNKWLPKSKR